MLLIQIDKDGKLEENGWREIPDFVSLFERYGEKGMKALILICDSNSPYARLDDDEKSKRVAIQQIGQKDYEVFLKSSQFIKAKYLYQALDYDELHESRRILKKKLIEINMLIDQTPFNTANADKIKTYTQLQTKALDDINKITIRIFERGQIKKDLQAKALSGIEVFYEIARKNRTEDTLFRNKMRIERRNKALAEQAQRDKDLKLEEDSKKEEE